MARIQVTYDNGVNIESLLDDLGVDYDYDDGDRILIDSDDVELVMDKLEEAGVDAELI